MTPYDARLSALHEKLLRKRQLCAERNELNAQLSQLQKTERLFADRPFKPKQKIYVFPLSALRGGGVLLFFHDHRRTVGVF